jgi:CheY-like chemotaxis protein
MSEDELKFDILLIEDNPGDVRLTKEFLADNPYLNNLEVVNDGDEAVKLLNKVGQYKDSITPHLIILDLNLPKKNGMEVLKEIKSNEELKYIPIVVLTSSSSDSDVLNSYELYANCFITKPVDYQSYFELFTTLLYFWCHLARIPKTPDKNYNYGPLS